MFSLAELSFFLCVHIIPVFEHIIIIPIFCVLYNATAIMPSKSILLLTGSSYFSSISIVGLHSLLSFITKHATDALGKP